MTSTSLSSSSSSSLLRFRVLLPVAIAIFLTPIPTRLGFWKFLLTFNPALVGILPCTLPSKAEWGFTLEDLYGGGDGNGDGKPSQREQRIYRNRLWGQTALVTGANSGTGYEVALAMARLGVKVTLACRNPTKCRAAADRIRKDAMVVGRAEHDRGIYNNNSNNNGDDLGEEYVTTMTVDTSSLQSVKTFCEAFLEQSNGVPLDMLYLNAGIGSRATLPDGTNELSMDGIELTFATNVVGHHLMYRLLRPIIHPQSGSPERKTPARIVLTSSAASYDTRPYDYKIPPDLETLNRDPVVHMSHYSMSKLAQILWARELTARLDSANADTAASDSTSSDPNSVVYVNAAHPGAVATGIWEKLISNQREMDEQKGTRNNRWDGFMDSIMNYFLSVMWTSEEGALTLVYLGTAIDELEKQNIRGKYFHPQSQLITEHKNVYDNEEETNERQQKLWEFLDELVADYV